MQTVSTNAEAARRYTVVQKVTESEEITSFYLRPADGSAVESFSPGQYLTLDLNLSAEIRIRRTYSISCSPEVKECYRISIKRETAPVDRPDVPGGAGSGHMHDMVDVGHELSIYDPRGEFVLDNTSTRSVLLLSGGVGITPLLSMLYALADSNDRDVWFIHACRNGRVHALGDEVRQLASRSSRIRTHFCYETPDGNDVPGSSFDSSGLIGKSTIQKLLPLDDYDVYMCGPAAFMQAMYDLLTDLGIAENHIAYEFFGDGHRLKRSHRVLERQPSPHISSIHVNGSEVVSDRSVTFSGSGIEVVWDDSYTSLLEFAEAQGLSPNFSCRGGICGSCECELRSGEVEYVVEPLDRPGHGRALICCSVPVTDITLEL